MKMKQEDLDLCEKCGCCKTCEYDKNCGYVCKCFNWRKWGATGAAILLGVMTIGVAIYGGLQ